MIRNQGIVLGIVVILLLAGVSVYSFSDVRNGFAGSGDQVSVAWSRFELGGLFWIAVDQHYFEQNGLNLTLTEYPTGVASLQGVTEGKADIAVGVAEFPFVTSVLRHEDSRVMGVIDKSDIVYIIARKDRIPGISDLAGKKIGTIRGSAAEFYLGRFLALHGMTMDNVTLIDVRTPDEWTNAVAQDKIDAIVIGEPYASATKSRLGSGAIVWPAQSSQPLYALVVSSDKWLAGHPGQAKRFVASLAEAEIYIQVHPADSRRIIQNRLGFDPGYMETAWQQNRFSLTLDQSLVLAMEDESRWMIANKMTNATVVPDFRSYLYTDGMEAVEPGSVNIIS